MVIVFCLWNVFMSPRMAGLSAAGNPLGGILTQQRTHVESVMTDADDSHGAWRYAGVGKIHGGAVIGISRTPLHLGQTVIAEYQTGRYCLNPTTTRSYPKAR